MMMTMTVQGIQDRCVTKRVNLGGTTNTGHWEIFLLNTNVSCSGCDKFSMICVACDTSYIIAACCLVEEHVGFGIIVCSIVVESINSFCVVNMKCFYKFESVKIALGIWPSYYQYFGKVSSKET